MQQHSGQHLLSRALIASASARTRSFHLGERLCTIDVEMAPPEAGAIRTAESATNGLIWEDRPVTIREAPPEAGADPAAAAEATALAGLKLKPGDPVRTIVVEGFDATPCGGTHVARTGQVGAVAVTGWEPCRGLTRITFVCGGRVVRRLHETVATVDACVEGLSAPEPEVAGALRRLLAERERLGRHARALEAQMALQEAAREALSAPSIGGWSVLRRGWRIEEKSIDAAQLLARSFVAGPSRLALLAVIDGGRATVIAARSPGAGPAVGPALAEAARLMGGRGGGSAEQGRAGGLPAGSVDALLDELLARLAPADGEAAG
jgi:alanyl-tRNA synthetase